MRVLLRFLVLVFVGSGALSCAARVLLLEWGWTLYSDERSSFVLRGWAVEPNQPGGEVTLRVQYRVRDDTRYQWIIDRSDADPSRPVAGYPVIEGPSEGELVLTGSVMLSLDPSMRLDLSLRRWVQQDTQPRWDTVARVPIDLTPKVDMTNGSNPEAAFRESVSPPTESPLTSEKALLGEWCDVTTDPNASLSTKILFREDGSFRMEPYSGTFGGWPAKGFAKAWMEGSWSFHDGVIDVSALGYSESGPSDHPSVWSWALISIAPGELVVKRLDDSRQERFHRPRVSWLR